jgi:hypothetical protein
VIARGRVVTSLPGVRLDSVEIRLRTLARPGSGYAYRTTPHASGRFEVGGSYAGDACLYVDLTEDSPVTARALPDLRLPARDPVVVELIAGIEVSGLVVDATTGAPLPGATLAFQSPARPARLAPNKVGVSDARGRYRFRSPSGSLSVVLISPPKGYACPPENPPSVSFEAPEGRERILAPPLMLIKE